MVAASNCFMDFFMDKILIWVGISALLILVLGAAFIMFRSRLRLKKTEKPDNYDDDDSFELNVNPSKMIEKCNRNTVRSIISTSKAYFLCFEGFFNNDRQQIKSAITEAEEFDKRAKRLKDNIFKVLQKLQHDQIETGHFYVQVIDYLREMAHSLNYTVKPVYTHFESKHKSFEIEQINQFNEFGVELNNFFNYALYILKEKRFDNLDELIAKRNMLVNNLKELEKNQIKRIKNNQVSTRNSILYFNIIAETKSLLLNLINVVKAQRDFIRETKLNGD
jgi:Na+/phosphate symporter